MTTTNPTPALPRYHASDSYYHPNAKGTGSAVKLELHPAHDDIQGSIFVTLAAQKSVGGGDAFPTFEWKNSITLKLDRSDLSQILQVLRGMQESAMDGKGLFHRGPRGTASIKFQHQIEPRPGYMLSVWKNYASGQQQHGYYFFSVDEALPLMLSLERAMMYVCFGIPEVIPRQPGRVAAPRVVSTEPGAAVPGGGSACPPPDEPAIEYRAVSGDPF